MEDYKTHLITSDLCLASVISMNFPLESLDKTDKRKIKFIFKRSKELDLMVEMYTYGKLKIEPRLFFNQIKELKNRLYSNY
jgi:hypothetical protein